MDFERERDRAEFYLLLARAFLPPTWPGAREAMADALAADLQALAEVLGYDIAAPLEEYRRAMAALDELELLRCYSRLFLTPPVAVRINPCYYLDGALMGHSVTELADWYRSAGLERAETFHDLPDHVSAQLEFAATLFSRAAAGAAPQPDAGEFLHRFVARWLPPFIADLARAHRENPNPYLFLARVLAIAVARDSARDEDALAEHSAPGAAHHPPAEPLAGASVALPADGEGRGSI